MSEANQILRRFHRTLVEEIREQRPEYLTGPFTVAEIYQNLVPYGTHRDRIGVEMNGDYEDALLRLLAGEGGFVILESEPALRDLRAELDTPNPNTGLYREYAAVDVRLNPAHLDLDAPAVREELDLTEEPDAAAFVSQAVSAPSGAVLEHPAVAPHGGPAGAPDSPDEPSAAVGRACQWCRAELPVRDNLNFCPFCGTDLKLFPCNECGEELEAEWRFCVSCGTEVSR